ncbi:hypothetical protein AB0J81_36710 [Streptomyces bobili]
MDSKKPLERASLVKLFEIQADLSAIAQELNRRPCKTTDTALRQRLR